MLLTIIKISNDYRESTSYAIGTPKKVADNLTKKGWQVVIDSENYIQLTNSELVITLELSVFIDDIGTLIKDFRNN